MESKSLSSAHWKTAATALLFVAVGGCNGFSTSSWSSSSVSVRTIARAGVVSAAPIRTCVPWSSGRPTTTTQHGKRALHMMGSHEWGAAAAAADGIDPTAAQFLLHQWWGSTSQWLADAAVTVADETNQPTDVGWWGSYINLFKQTLNWVHSTIDQPLHSIGVEQTWGIAIALFTAGIRSLLLPLSIQQSKSSEYLKALRPYQNEIKARFKNNQDAQNRAVAKLFEDANQNPLAGCLVSLAQLPVFLGLYRGVRLLAMDGELQEPFLWIPSLEGPVSAPNYQGLDWILSGWTPSIDGSFLPVPMLGWETTLAFLLMPILLVMLQSATMNALQPPMEENMSEEERKTAETSQSVLKFLPLMIGFFSLQVPAGLTIYWFTSNIFTLTQSLAVRAYYTANPPKIELPDYWDAALNKDMDYESMSPEERRKAAMAGIRIGPSLDELIDEARFHCLIERRPFRSETEAWRRVVSSITSTNINGEVQDDHDTSLALVSMVPKEMEEWVRSSNPGPVRTEVPSSATA